MTNGLAYFVDASMMDKKFSSIGTWSSSQSFKSASLLKKVGKNFFLFAKTLSIEGEERERDKWLKREKRERYKKRKEKYREIREKREE